MQKLNINGFTVLHEKKPSDIINVRVIVNAGSTSESPNEYGAAHYLEHMFFKGTKKHSYKEINRMTSELGDANAYTSSEQTVFHISSLSIDFQKAVSILMEMFFEPLFPEEEFEKERTVILEEYQSMLDRPMSYFLTMTNEGFWGSARGHKVIGNRNTLNKMGISDLMNFRARNYVIDNFVFAVVGNIDVEEVEKVFSNHLVDVPSIHYGKLNSSKINDENIDCSDLAFNHKSKQAIIGFTSKGLSEIEEHERNYVQDLLAAGMGGGMHSLLFDRIREELGLCYSVGTYTDTYADTGCVTTFCMLDESNIELAKTEIQKVFDKVRKEGFDEELLAISKKNLLFDVAKHTESSNGFSYIICDNYFKNGGTLFDFEETKKKIMAVTNDEIIKFANEVLNENNRKYSQMTNG